MENMERNKRIEQLESYFLSKKEHTLEELLEILYIQSPTVLREDLEILYEKKYQEYIKNGYRKTGFLIQVILSFLNECHLVTEKFHTKVKNHVGLLWNSEKISQKDRRRTMLYLQGWLNSVEVDSAKMDISLDINIVMAFLEKESNYKLSNDFLKAIKKNLKSRQVNRTLLSDLLHQYGEALTKQGENNPSFATFFLEQILQIVLEKVKRKSMKEIVTHQLNSLELQVRENLVQFSPDRQRELKERLDFIKQLFLKKLYVNEKKQSDMLQLQKEHYLKFSTEVGAMQRSPKGPTTNLEIFTIGKSNSTVHNYGLSIDLMPNGIYQLGIYISDLSVSLPSNQLMKLAKSQGETLYLNENTYSLLPVNWAYDRHNLEQGQNREVIGLLFEIDSQGKIVQFNCKKEVIYVDFNWSYEKVDRTSKLTRSSHYKKFTNLFSLIQAIQPNKTEEVSFGNMPVIKALPKLENFIQRFMTSYLEKEELKFIYSSTGEFHEVIGNHIIKGNAKELQTQLYDSNGRKSMVEFLYPLDHLFQLYNLYVIESYMRGKREELKPNPQTLATSLTGRIVINNAFLEKVESLNKTSQAEEKILKLN